LVEQARKFFVHSEFAARLTRLDANPEDEAKIAVVPFGHPPPDEAAAAPNREEALVATFGLATPAKRIEILIDAFGKVVKTVPHARLAVVGDIEPASDRNRYESELDRAGLSANVQLLGRVDRHEYRDYLRRATVAVQLRSVTYGENSGAVADCLAGGVPTIVSALGAARELPDSAVVKVGTDCTAEQLGHEIAALLQDGPRREMLSADGLAYARANSFAKVADALFRELATKKERRSIRRAATA